MPGFVGVHRNPSRWQAVVHQREIRHSTAGCLLSVLLFAPLFVREYGLCAVAAVGAVYAVVVVPAAAGYISLPALATRCIRSLSRRLHAAPAPVLGLLLMLPFVALLLRPYTEVLVAVWAVYCLLLVPLALKGQLPTSFSIGSSGVAHALLALPALLCTALGWSASTAFSLLKIALLLPFYCVLHTAYLCCSAAAALHSTLLQSTAAVRCMQQLMFFVHLEHTLLPSTQLQLTALVHLLSYNICFYICSRLTTGGWITAHINQSGTARGNTHTPASQSAAANVSSFTAAKLGKAVVLSLVLNASWAQYVEVNPWFSFLSAAYFVMTAQRCTPTSALVFWAQHLNLGHLLLEEEVVVPLVVNAAPPAASLLLLGSCLTSHSRVLLTLRVASWWQVASVMATLAATYTNVLLPLQLLHHDWTTSHQLEGGRLCRFWRASVQDCTRQGTCPVCLEELGSGRVTVCRHVYHDTCLSQLIVSGHTRCPLCNVSL